MKKKLPDTHMQKLGFFEDDLKIPLHDDMIKWIDSNKNNIIKLFYPNFFILSDKIKNDLIDRRKKAINRKIDYLLSASSHPSLGEITSKKVVDKISIEKEVEELKKVLDIIPAFPVFYEIESSWEYEIVKHESYKKTPDIIGFVDFAIFLYKYEIFIDRDFSFQISKDFSSKTLYLEAKTKITSLGELFRQLNTYKRYHPNAHYIVVCPDESNKSIIEEQGFSFIKYNL